MQQYYVSFSETFEGCTKKPKEENNLRKNLKDACQKKALERAVAFESSIQVEKITGISQKEVNVLKDLQLRLSKHLSSNEIIEFDVEAINQVSGLDDKTKLLKLISIYTSKLEETKTISENETGGDR